MWDRLVEICSGADGWQSVAIMGSDLMIGLAYYSIPFTMLWVFRSRQEDIPYPWLWMLFVTFIFACGTTHLTHIWSQTLGLDSNSEAIAKVFTAVVSVGTAVAFTFAIPQIRLLPSPARQKAELEEAVAEAVRGMEASIRELNHRSGNMRQIMLSILHLWEKPPKGMTRDELRILVEARIMALSEEYDAISAESDRALG